MVITNDTLIIAVALFVVTFAILTSFIDKLPKKNKEIKTTLPKQAHGIIFGKKMKKVVYSPEDSEGSVGVFSASGTGKTSAVCIPTLRSWTGTSFTIDISGDICKNCPDMPHKLIYDPTSDVTAVYNVFGVIDDIADFDGKNEALEQLAFLIMPPCENANENAKFFLDNGRKILTASLIAFYHSGFDFVDICKKIVSSSWKDLFAEIDKTQNETAIMLINGFSGASEQNTAGCKQSADDACKLFATNAKIQKSIKRPSENEESITPKKLESHNIFVIVDDPLLKLYAPVLHIITAQIMQYISSRDLSNKTPILLCLDEFASLGKLEILEALRKYRKRHCRVLIMTQNLADLEIIYGAAETRAIMANLKYKLLLGGLGEVESQEYFAKLIGYKTVKKISTSKNAQTVTQNESEAKEYIIEPAQLDRLGNDNLILIHSENDGYLKLNKAYYFKDGARK